MSTNSRQPNENQEVNQPVSQNAPDKPTLPVPRETLPVGREELSEEKRKRLNELAERANMAHDQAKDAAVRFCRHSIEAGLALLEAQQLCPKRMWGAWLKKHFDGSRSTAYRYMDQAKDAATLGGSVPNLTQNPSEDLSRLFTRALKRIAERQRAASIDCGEMPSSAETDAGTLPPTMGVETSAALSPSIDNSLPSSADEDLLAKASALFDELLDVLRRAMESGQALGYGQFVLDELERLRGDLDVCRLLIRDAHLGTGARV
jgi:hypothetical protein